jgi:Tfp pilus assembly protein PilN
VVIGGLAAAFNTSEKATRRIDSEYAAVEAQYVQEAQRIQQVREMQEKQKTMARQAELTASLLERIPRSHMLAEITNNMPAGLSLLELQMESKLRPKPAAATPAPANRRPARPGAAPAVTAPPPPEPKLHDVFLKLTGVARTDVQVAQYMNNLSRSPLLRDINLVISDEFVLDKERLRRFQIEMMLDPVAEAPANAGDSKTVRVELGSAQ